MSGTPLPPNPYDGFEQAAYNTCLYLEGLRGRNGEAYRTPQLCGRLLGYMMLEAPTPEGRHNVAKEIQTCVSASDTLERLSNLARFYENHFIRVFRAAKGRTPAVSTHPSRPSFNMTAQEVNLLLQEAPQDHRASKKLCLIRDNYRCVITGRLDFPTYDSMVQENPTFVSSTPVDGTELVHIIAESTNADIKDGTPKRDYAASAWTVLERFGKVDVEDDQLNGAGIHRLQNVMTMCLMAHVLFDELKMWLEEIGTNRYRVCVAQPHYFGVIGFNPNTPPVIELTSTRADLPLPDPRLLRLHAACAKVANLSGAGEMIDAILRDIEDLKVLAHDGGSADVLTAALLQRVGEVTVH